MSAALLLTVAARAQNPAPETWRVWLEPRFLRAPVSAPIPGAERTELAGGTLGAGELQRLSKGDFAKLGQPWEAFAEQARRNAAADFAQLKPSYIRDRRKTIQYAELRSEQPLVASAVLAPGFREAFSETLGPAILVVVPNQQTAFIFPKLASRYRDYASMVLRAYRETSHPVSLEVFEIGPDGISAIGAYADPARD